MTNSVRPILFIILIAGRRDQCVDAISVIDQPNVWLGGFIALIDRVWTFEFNAINL